MPASMRSSRPSVKEAIWSTTTRIRAASSGAAVNAGANTASRVAGAPSSSQSRHPVDAFPLPRLQFQVPRVGHDELQRQGLEHRDLGAHRRGHLQVSLVAHQRLRPGDLVGQRDRRRGEPADQLTGQPLERHRGSQCAVVLADVGDHRQPGQPAGRLLEITGAESAPGVDRAGLPQTPQGGRGVVVGQHPQVDAARHHTVLHVVHRVGHVVGPVHHLRLQARPLGGHAAAHPLRQLAVVFVEAELAPARTAEPRILRDGVQAGPGQVQPDAAALGVKHFGLDAGQDPEVLGVALEPAAGGGELVEGTLTVVAVRRVTDVVGQPGHVDQVGIAAQRHGHSPADLGDLQRMRQPGARGSRSPAARPPGSCRRDGETPRSAARGRGRGRSRCGARPSSRAARRSSAPPPPPARGRPRRSGPAESSSPRHSLPARRTARRICGRDAAKRPSLLHSYPRIG